MPALAAQRFNPIIIALRQRLLARGKSKMTVVIASMRKLLELPYGVLKPVSLLTLITLLTYKVLLDNLHDI